MVCGGQMGSTRFDTYSQRFLHDKCHHFSTRITNKQEKCFTGLMEKQTELRSMKNAEKENLEKSNQLEISSPTAHSKLHTEEIFHEYEALFKHDNKDEVR